MTLSINNNTMKLLHRPFVFLLLSIVLISPLFGQERTWHDNSGKFQVQAEYLGVIDAMVVLKKQNGNIIRVPLSKLSSADLEFLNRLNQQPATLSLPIPKSKSEKVQSKNSKTNPAVPSENAGKSTNQPVTAEPANGDVNIEPNVRNRTKADPIVVPAITVTDTQIAALPESLRKIAAVLQTGTDYAAIRKALTSLASNWPGENATILDLVRKTTFGDEKFCRKKALMLLCQHDLTNSFPFILARMDDPSFEVRWAAMEYIERSGDPRALKPLVERFIGPDRAKISRALMTYGSQTEPYLFEYLGHSRADVRMETSLLLGKLGSEASIPKLEELAENDTNPVVAMQAKSAIRNINDRLANSKD